MGHGSEKNPLNLVWHIKIYRNLAAFPFSVKSADLGVNSYTSKDTSLPGDLRRVKVKTDKGADFLWCKRCWVCFIDPKSLGMKKERR